MKFAIEKAKEAGVPLSLISVPAAHQFYEKLGFKDTTHVNVDLSKWGAPHSGYGIWRAYAMMHD